MRFSDIAYILFFLPILLSGTAYAQSRYDVQSTIQRLYGANAKVVPAQLKLTPETVARLSASSGVAHPWNAVEALRVVRGSGTAGWAFIDNVKGKSRPITYLVCFDGEAKILDVEILEYRESHGGEVASDMFRAQFRGKSDEDRLLVGRDIRNISGATISVRSVTKGTKALAALARHLMNGSNP
ncbi:MAG: FMN-binding protein [Bacteroidia bacterium]|nr:FMN-binding protein [Bacteroidia bacterium]